MTAMNEVASEGSSVIDGNPPRRNWASFWSLLTLQSQNAFNDKAAQFLLIPIGAWLVKTGADVAGTEHIKYILAAVIVIPFILFSPLAGWFSDRYSKTAVIRGASVLQLGVLLWIAAAIHFHQLQLAVLGFFMLSVQSVMLSPAKRGIVKELMGHKKLGMASGLMEIFAVLSICAGQIITGFWYTARLKESGDGWNAALVPLIILAGGSVVALLVSMSIQKVPAQGHREFKKEILWEHFGQLRELWQERALRLSAVGAAFFWGYAGYLNLAAIGIAEKLTDLGDEFAEVSAVLMLAASLGIVLGGGIASAVCRKRIELGLVPLGGLVMVIGTLALAATPLESAWLKLWLLVAGAGGALMLVPLNANLQDLCPPKKRGKILAGLNLLDCLAGLLAVVIQLVLVAVGVPFWIQFIGLAVVCVIATNYSAKLLPQHVVRLVGLSLFKLFYKVKTTGAENMPKEGGVLLTPNHVSYVDAFILSVASPREVRFLMFDGYFKHPIIGPMVKLFNTVPISKTRAKDAVRVAAEALEDGAVVCIFPEGQLTRTGVMNEFKRGFEMIARKANCPVLPATMDGLWGSIFSYERNQFIYKSPYTARYGVSVKFGEPIPAGEASVPTVRSVIEANRADVFAERICVLEPEKVLMSSPLILRGGSVAYRSALEAILLLELDEKRKIVANALQIGDTNTICRGQTVMMDWSGLGAVRNTIAVALAQYLDLKLVVVDSVNEAESIPMLAHKYGVDHFCGGETMSQVHREHRLAGVCYDFSESAVQRSDAYPCLVTDGVVVSMSMPHPEENTATNQHQAGWGEGTWGRLLPGFFPQETDGGILLKGASVASSGLVVSGVTLDANAMVIVD